MPGKKKNGASTALTLDDSNPSVAVAPEALEPEDDDIPEFEPRSRRFQLMLQPSLHSRLQTAAKKQRRSVNDIIHAAMEKLYPA